MNTKAIATAIAIGAVLGAASYFMHSSPAALAAGGIAPQEDGIDRSTLYWDRYSARANVAQYEKLACRTLYGEHWYPNASGECLAPVDCTSCVTHKGVAHNAVIHDNAWVRAPKAGGPNYDAMMRQDKLVFQMAMARQGEVEAGRRAYDHTVRCQRVYAGADIQCKN